MQKALRNILPEAIWLTSILAFTFILAIIIFGSQFLNDSIDFNVHDTYFVIPSWQFVTVLFLLVTLITYIIKGFKNNYGRNLPTLILLVTGFLLIVLITLLIRSLSQVLHRWTAYPPLSALGPTSLPEFQENPFRDSVITFFTILQLSLVLVISIISYRWGIF